MDISVNWVQDFVKLPKGVTPAKLQDALTMHSFELEGHHDWSTGYDHIVVGELTKLEKHPDADKLQVAKVADGKKEYTIVCGGSNLREGMKVALGKAGAKVCWHGEGDLIELKDTKIRGVISQGMICAAEEIGLATGHEAEREIMDLSDIDAKPGTSLAKALLLDDITLDVDNKGITNRPDAWSHYGVAREIAAIYNTPLTPYPHIKITPGKKMNLTVRVEAKELCRRYMGVVVDGVNVAPSPMWMQARLRAAGVRAINNIVDITNYVMLELGQPMHAFDLNLLTTPEIIVRRAKKNEKFVPLGREEIALSDAMCVIADTKRAIAIAGVKGGEESGINGQTKTIVLEAANFEPLAVRRTAQALDLRTDASSRFEKALDPNMVEVAMARCIELIQQLMPKATVISNTADDGDWKKIAITQPITLDISFLTAKLGIEIPVKEVMSILQRLGFGVQNKKDHLVVDVPSWRATGDIEFPEDLVEEVGRVYGYDKIAEDLPVMVITPPEANSEREVITRARNVLVDRFGFAETQSYSFMSEDTLHKLDLDEKEYIKIANPLSSEQTHVRRHLVPNVLYQMSKNLNGFSEVRLCEFAKVFLKEEKGDQARPDAKTLLPYQPYHVVGLVSSKTDSTPVFAAKAAALGMLDALGVKYRVEPHEHQTNWMHPSRTLTVYHGKERIADISELHPAYMAAFDLESRVGFFSMDLTRLAQLRTPKTSYTPLQKFPSVKRDLAFIVPDHIRFDWIKNDIVGVDPLLTHVELFDVYRGKSVGKHMKSLAFHLEFSHPERTLTASEVDVVYGALIKTLTQKHKITLRT